MAHDPRRDGPGAIGEAMDAVADTVAEVIDDVVEDVAEDVGELVSRLREDLLGREGYLVVLIMTVVAVVAIPVDATFRGGGIVTASILGLLVFTTMSRSKVSRRLRVASAVVIAISFILAVVLTITNDRAEAEDLTWLAATFAATYTVMIGLCFPAILRHAFTHRRITLNTVAAAIAAYLMIGLIFTSLFRFVEIVAPPFFTQTNTNQFTFEYFSFITLSTVGYGDFSPANDAGRTLAMLEGVFGQIFLVTIVALVVSNLGVERRQLRHTMGERASAATPDDAGAEGALPAESEADGPSA